MIIYPNPDGEHGSFRMYLVAQELENLRDGVLASRLHDSPWGKGVVENINAALAANKAYLASSWPPRAR